VGDSEVLISGLPLNLFTNNAGPIARRLCFSQRESLLSCQGQEPYHTPRTIDATFLSRLKCRLAEMGNA
jgi:hypothetical protein